jgi:hypothetical protein
MLQDSCQKVQCKRLCQRIHEHFQAKYNWEAQAPIKHDDCWTPWYPYS